MKHRLILSPVVWALVLAAAGGQWLLGQARPPQPSAAAGGVETEISNLKSQIMGAAHPAPSSSATVAPASVPSHRPAGYQPKVAVSGAGDHHGQAVGVACMTCHTSKTPNLGAGTVGAVPAEFHQGLVYAHGWQSCLSCHHSQDYDALRLADGRKLAFADAQKLCQQCHGPQARDYLNGAHGGMAGYWDKTKGARTRNTCTDCHDPHAPKYPQWTPVFAPKDDGALQQKARDAQSHPAPHAPHSN
jgi:hypothetical protein